MIRAFCDWLAATPLSAGLGSTKWAVPAIQTVHILAIAAVLSSALMLELRVLEVDGRSQSMRQAGRRFVPWLIGGLIVLAATGALLIISEPSRSLLNAAFWSKMGLLLFALTATFGLQGAQWRMAAAEPPHANVRVLAVITLLLWCAIVVAGRWIAYAGHG